MTLKTETESTTITLKSRRTAADESNAPCNIDNTRDLVLVYIILETLKKILQLVNFNFNNPLVTLISKWLQSN